ncbi:putative OPA3-like protein CG13603 [Diorhabda sublineata]|uniref:putative OPA3-like protein CG13603 n=1 Tax=Diorhabda sublineata TaxID=1163346 RepID=UPI0024E0D87D|nr:putative OPA3-like protein CG13603 [Diorhabda sublineata]
MVVGAFPAAKLGALLLKQISKPIANVVKNQAKSSPVFRKYVCMPPAQFYNWCEVKAKMWILNLGKPVNIPVLNEAMAIELGANLLGEGIIFLIAAGMVVFEYNRSSRKEAAKEEAKAKEMYDLKNTITELFMQTEEQGAQLRELTRKLGDLEKTLHKRIIHDTPKPPPDVPQKSGTVISHSLRNDFEPSLTSSINNYAMKPNEIENQRSSGKQFFRHQNPSIILRAVNDVENQFWNHPFIEEQEDSFLILSLYYVQSLLRL